MAAILRAEGLSQLALQRAPVRMHSSIRACRAESASVPSSGASSSSLSSINSRNAWFLWVTSKLPFTAMMPSPMEPMISSSLSRSSRRRSMTLESRAESVLSVLSSSPSSSCVPRDMRAPYSPSEMRRATCVRRRMGFISTCVIFMAITTANSTVTAAVIIISICK